MRKLCRLKSLKHSEYHKILVVNKHCLAIVGTRCVTVTFLDPICSVTPHF